MSLMAKARFSAELSTSDNQRNGDYSKLLSQSLVRLGTPTSLGKSNFSSAVNKALKIPVY